MQVKIGPVFYDVRVVNDLKNSKGHDLYGQADHEYNSINLNPRYGTDQRFLTLWHEVLHCFEPVFGVSMSEKQVTRLSALIALAIKDNPILRGEDGYLD